MKVAVIGSGISGLACAHYLQKSHEISVFEAGSQIGGHTATVDVKLGTRRFAIDTGFIVFNDWTYPNFIKLVEELGVSYRPTTMGFSVNDPESGLEYSGTNLDTLFAQRKNLLSPKFISMVRDILRFNKESVADLESGALNTEETLGDYVQRVFQAPVSGGDGFGNLVCRQHYYHGLSGSLLFTIFQKPRAVIGQRPPSVARY